MLFLSPCIKNYNILLSKVLFVIFIHFQESQVFYIDFQFQYLRVPNNYKWESLFLDKQSLMNMFVNVLRLLSLL